MIDIFLTTNFVANVFSIILNYDKVYQKLKKAYAVLRRKGNLFLLSFYL